MGHRLGSGRNHGEDEVRKKIGRDPEAGDLRKRTSEAHHGVLRLQAHMGLAGGLQTEDAEEAKRLLKKNISGELSQRTIPEGMYETTKKM